ncbi:DUF2129 domain-containing protein [Lactobacillus sp. S2-2]|uniref:YlbG family protein n=1 Tax=Lactobacillus sp. S2-2 TaxID=2692917 RepID=UPI001F1AE0C8|nr:YlbG family protein [Lactobacillus sp. S2-2]MCF6514885.1 DUF2129 domain-containing protein [Lactobacillus sp. S2-2]
MSNLDDRVSLIVYLYNLKQNRNLKKFGNIVYISKKMKYIVIYLDNKDIDEKISDISKVKGVRRVIKSPMASLARQFLETQKELISNDLNDEKGDE